MDILFELNYYSIWIILGLIYLFRTLDILTDLDLIKELNKNYPETAKFYGMETLDTFSYFIMGFFNVRSLVLARDTYFTDKLMLNDALKDIVRFKRIRGIFLLIVLIGVFSVRFFQ
jgi:hypothetical protein